MTAERIYPPTSAPDDTPLEEIDMADQPHPDVQRAIKASLRAAKHQALANAAEPGPERIQREVMAEAARYVCMRNLAQVAGGGDG